jgi:UDP-N-acetyl-D-mannosaminuronate dehydrogenase
MYLWNDPDATIVRAARTANKAMPRYAVELLSERLGGLKDKKVVVFGAAYRNGVKETAFSGVFDLVAELRAANAIPAVHDPLYSDEELSHYGFIPFHLSETAEGGIIQTDHMSYSAMTSADTPGMKCIVDGRNIVNQTLLGATEVITIGAPSSTSMS